MTKNLCFLSFALGVLLLLPSGAHAVTGEKLWSMRFEPVYVDVGGHDPPLVGTSTGTLSLETDSGLGYHFEIRRDRRQRWGWGADFFWYTGAQDTSRQTAADGSGSPITWEIADGSFTSSRPGEVLFLERLSDSDLNVWTADLYTLRTLSSSDRGSFQLLLGIRNADFDNDTRAVVGIESTGGTRIDASSNYSRMIGPLVGIAINQARGKNRFELTLTQSAVTGDAELSATQSDFVGSFTGDSQEFTATRTFMQPDSVTIPITDLRARWSYAVTSTLAVGVGAHASVWTDVSIPPGVRPSGSLDTTYETTITFSGLVAVVEISF
jgi:hypothetical protein